MCHLVLHNTCSGHQQVKDMIEHMLRRFPFLSGFTVQPEWGVAAPVPGYQSRRDHSAQHVCFRSDENSPGAAGHDQGLWGLPHPPVGSPVRLGGEGLDSMLRCGWESFVLSGSLIAISWLSFQAVSLPGFGLVKRNSFSGRFSIIEISPALC